MSNEEAKPLARSADLVTKEVGDEVLVYDLRNDKAHCLNQTAATVWKYCDGKATVAEIVLQLKNDLTLIMDEMVVWQAIERLNKAQLLEESVLLPDENPRLSRRETMRRLGRGTVVALPVVLSLVVPMAVHAQTTACTNPGNYGDACRCSPGTGFPGNCAGTGSAGTQVCPSGPSPNSCRCHTTSGTSSPAPSGQGGPYLPGTCR